jgi:hypothetical protein
MRVAQNGTAEEEKFFPQAEAPGIRQEIQNKELVAAASSKRYKAKGL